jgi:hypothetical protein
VQIGLRTLGGDPEAFYRLDLERQIDVLAVLQAERDLAKKPKRGNSMEERVDFASEDAQAYWSHAFRS